MLLKSLLLYKKNVRVKYASKLGGGGRIKLRKNRLAALADCFSAPCVKEFVDDLEYSDIQFQVAKRLVLKRGLEEAALLIVGAALVSYMLTLTGDEHWKLFLRYAESGEVEQALKRFISESSSMRLYRAAKLKRLEKYLMRFTPLFRERFELYAQNLEAFWKDLARALGSERDSKTVVFAVKMFYYVLKASGRRVEVPASIPIPVDFRVCLITITSGLVDVGSRNPVSGARELRKKAGNLVRSAWSAIASKCSIPPLRVDTVLWVCGGALVRANMVKERALEEVSRLLKRSLRNCERKLLEEIFKYAPG